MFACYDSKCALQLLLRAWLKEWEVNNQHLFREGNRAADSLAHFCHSLHFFGVQYFDVAHLIITEIIREDMEGGCRFL